MCHSAFSALRAKKTGTNDQFKTSAVVGIIRVRNTKLLSLKTQVCVLFDKRRGEKGPF